MAHEILSSDGLVLTRKMAWHGLGVVVDHAPSAVEALGLARLDWRVEQWPLVARSGEVSRDVDSHVLNVRSDTREPLGVVGSGYSPVQNGDLARFVDALGADGSVKIESAGSIRGGKRVWFLAQGESVWVTDRDEVKTYLLVANGHDGTMAVTAQPTSVRVVCSNTLHMALRDRARAVRFRHEGDVSSKLDAARIALGIFNKSRDAFQEQVHTLNAKTLDSDTLRRFFVDVYTQTIEPIPAAPANAAERESVADARAVLSQWSRNFEADIGKVQGAATAWTALNSVTQWFDHQKQVRGKDHLARQQNRLYAKWWGEAADSKAAAMNAAMALV